MSAQKADNEQVEAVRIEYVVDDFRLVLGPHQLDEDPDGPPSQSQVTCVIGQDSKQRLGVFALKDPVEIQSFHSDPFQGLLASI